MTTEQSNPCDGQVCAGDAVCRVTGNTYVCACKGGCPAHKVCGEIKGGEYGCVCPEGIQADDTVECAGNRSGILIQIFVI